MRQNYISRLQAHMIKDGTIDPTEGTVKCYKTYTDDDPVVAFLFEKDETELAGKDWDPEWDCMYFKEAMDGTGKCTFEIQDGCQCSTNLT